MPCKTTQRLPIRQKKITLSTETPIVLRLLEMRFNKAKGFSLITLQRHRSLIRFLKQGNFQESIQNQSLKNKERAPVTFNNLFAGIAIASKFLLSELNRESYA